MLGRLLAPVRGRLWAAAGLQVVAAVAGLVPYVMVAELARELLGAGDAGRAWAIVGVAVAAVVVRIVAMGAAVTVTHLTDGGSLDPAGLIVLLALATRFTEPLLLAAELGGALRMGRNNLARFAEILATPTLPEPAEPVRQPPLDAPAIQLDHVDFGYATVRAADQIVVLDGGRVAETGDHDRLLAAGGRYAAFWRERTRAAGWRLISREDGRHDHAASEPSSGTTSQFQS